MIKRAFLSAILLFLGYNLALRMPWVRGHFLTQSQWQGNLIQAQDYPLGGVPRRNVIVGSSLMARLSPTSLDADFYSLSFSGDGPLTGLELIARHHLQPRLVLIETNLVNKVENREVLANAFRPVFCSVRHYLPALRERYQPANFAVSIFLERMVRHSLRIARGLLPASSPPNAETGGHGPLFQTILESQRRDLTHAPDGESLQLSIARLRAHVAELTRRGSRCVFVEMPIDASLTELPSPTAVRNRLAVAFPESETPWIRPESGRRYHTEDGLHLSPADAEHYASYIRTELNRLGLQP